MLSGDSQLARDAREVNVAKPFAWSYSALTRFENCPKQYWHINVERDFKDKDNEFAAEGKKIHDAMYKRVVKDIPLPLEFRSFESTAAKFATAPGEKRGEIKLALNAKMQPVDFFAGDVWVRSIVDLLIVKSDEAIVVDWKTGKVKDDPTQMALCAAVLSRWMPEITKFTTLFVFLKHRTILPHTFTARDMSGIWNAFQPRVDKIEQALKTTTFPAKSSGFCKFCPVTNCVHNTRG
jgi:hypothetical protein